MSSGVRSWFCVFNNPEWINIYDSEGNIIDKKPSEYNGLEPQEICDSALQAWTQSKPNRYGWVGYCISADGLHHLHMVLESKSTIEFSSVKKVFPRAHLSITRGSKKEVEDYINKRGKFEEKGEEVVCWSQDGQLKGQQGKRSDLVEIQNMINLGMKPSQIIGSDIKKQRYAEYVKRAYLAKRESETPLCRDVKVIWHYGKPGSGKSYTYLKLAEKYGRDEIYKIVRDLSKGRFDDYQGEKILFLDELKPNCIDWVDLLTCLDNYMYKPAARYQNSVSLWTEVHITSIYTPKQFYEELLTREQRFQEPFSQLDRRIDLVLHHWVDHEGHYRTDNDNLYEFINADEVIDNAKLLPFK